MKRLLITAFLFAVALYGAGPDDRFRIGQPFNLKLDGLPPHVASLRVTLTSKCDDEMIFESDSSFRRNGSYYASLIVPESAGPCNYGVTVTYWLPEQENPEESTREDIRVER